jgi:hypothetical protein
LWLVLALPAAGFENDYAALFAAHADKVLETQPGIRQLELPGPILVEERRRADGSVAYSGTDLSGQTAAGCGMGLLIDLVVLTGSCPDMITAAERAVLEAALLDVAGFVGANAFPPVPQDDVRPRLVALIQARKSRLDIEGMACDPGDSGQQDAAEIARNLARPGGQASIARMISLPRLPVENDCL